MFKSASSILNTTRENIRSNIRLSISTVVVTSILFFTAALFALLVIGLNKMLVIAEKQAPLEVFFYEESKAEDIEKVIAKIQVLPGVAGTRYIDKAEALQIYAESLGDERDLVEYVDESWLPPSVQIQARSITDLESIAKAIDEERKTNPIIESVLYKEDIVNNIKSTSQNVKVAGGVVTIFFAIISITLIIITISFNIMTHKNEIDIMQLIGSRESLIKTPYLVEGTIYTLLGGIFAASAIAVPWYSYILYTRITGGEVAFNINQFLIEADLEYLKYFDLKIIFGFYAVMIAIALAVGLASSMFAVAKYLNPKDR